MYDGPIIDIDLHHRWKTEDDLFRYLPSKWRQVMDRSRSAIFAEAPVAMFHHSTGTNKRGDAFPGDGAPPGSSYEMMCAQWLDPFPVERGVLSYDIGTSGGVPNPLLATALTRAANDWSLAEWIDRYQDPRLYTACLVPTQIIEDGVAEVNRLADNPRIVEALMVSNGMSKPFGHPVYHPIYAAAQDVGLPIAIHNGGDQYAGTSHMMAGGMPNSRFEFHTLAPQSTVHHLTSFITHGVFEKFPKLKLMIIEIGMAWLPWLIWSLDRQYENLVAEGALISRLPSEIFRDHIRVTTQPVELTPQRGQLGEALQSVDGLDEVLCFASDYPHWDTDDPSYIARRIPESWWTKVFYSNTLETLRWAKGETNPRGLEGVGAGV
jgi:predicted TIM-barrel fold metal-dependent hydrolase